MTKDELIEATARAIYEADDPWHKAWPWPDLQSDQAGVDQYCRIAEAALAIIAPAVLDLAVETATCGDTGTRLSEQIIADEIRALKERFV